MKKSRILLIFLFIFVLLTTVFIFSNSFKDITASHQQSNSFVELVSPAIDVNEDDKFLIVNTIRKFAHLFEFCVLGFFIYCLLSEIYKIFSKKIFLFGIIYIFSVAILDEFFQLFFGRNSSVFDVFLDFFGGLFGFLLGIIFIKLLRIAHHNFSDRRQKIEQQK